ncbi:protein TSSC4 [Oncorhynchus kisutch]|uniref:protein TSSC4 n=1 Tax=Oncorhynchus kisutch TaxID=8019 RepID=UPI0009A08118|nr:protein TSSC4 [Oncorhynchus kisutch]XP_020335178.1 protein TSSC4 [Oncorhynchus kisutch]XP_020335179.1 protein TSSC4 [Oncorhynchus kisutch]XP_020335180.1 protein TSSC4 [Oncorhynchus kisutch]XP_020335181.1 protein TSSC4 [Oncorhynchus kisutch]XP_020335182.1 protein TSSC4 [Oncorhynchus kisutch]XP_020335183.1 protein TSSC4 [Oncorhynchus kisutch]XP_020335184.1 protein TSSC4 [Oncorhynchus kisutch]XP_031668785.1 protein TSSC4 [Oncorhynchus kisutch]XP_031668793.1 protein TSSC4 [Oncorhynchus kisu
MCEQEDHGDGGRNKLSNSDAIKLTDNFSLSDSDPEERNESIDPEVEDLSSSDDDEHQNSCPGPGPKKPAFSLTGGSSSFSNRSRSIFDCLESAAKLSSSHLGQDNVIDGVFARPPPPPLLPSGKKYGEKVGELVSKPPQKRGVPDYLVNPERWTRYDLEDVPETSDSKNSMVAQQYIQSLQQKEKESTMEDDPEEPFTPTFNQGQSSSSEHKIVFSRPSRPQKDESAEVNKPDRTKAGMGLCHLDDEEEEGIGQAIAPQRPKESERKRKWTPVGDAEGVLIDRKDQPSIGFVISRNIKRKNFRKVSEKEED